MVREVALKGAEFFEDSHGRRTSEGTFYDRSKDEAHPCPWGKRVGFTKEEITPQWSPLSS